MAAGGESQRGRVCESSRAGEAASGQSDATHRGQRWRPLAERARARARSAHLLVVDLGREKTLPHVRPPQVHPQQQRARKQRRARQTTQEELGGLFHGVEARRGDRGSEQHKRRSPARARRACARKVRFARAATGAHGRSRLCHGSVSSGRDAATTRREGSGGVGVPSSVNRPPSANPPNPSALGGAPRMAAHQRSLTRRRTR